MYWNNIPDSIKQGQKSVFDALRINLIQENANLTSHGEWMNGVLKRSDRHDIVVFADIDAFPLNISAYSQAIEIAASGAIFGLAQFSEHKASKEIYAGPMFIAFRKSIWEDLGRPTLEKSSVYDAAESLTARARQNGVPIHLTMPTACLIPKWALAGRGLFGIGTFYGECQFFHLFESRQSNYSRILDAVVSDVVAGVPLGFKGYLEIAHELVSGGTANSKMRWVPKPLRRFLS